MMQPKTYVILDRAIEEGIRYGINRAIKYEHQLSDDQLIEEIRNSVMNEICECFDIETSNVHS
jgi:hypothetical protein